MTSRTVVVIFFITLIISACSSARISSPGQDVTPPEPTVTFAPTITSQPSVTPIPPMPTKELIQEVCSPLEGESLASIPEILTQAFKKPLPGNDDGHTGADFAFYRRNEFVGIEGLKVKAAIEGKVVTIINDRWPYGNAVLIETPLKDISRELIGQITLPVNEPTVMPDPRVNCPPGALNFSMDDQSQSLYTLYAHLLNNATFTVGDNVGCGEVIGAVGNSGYSSNPHLHFETRVGPSGARFDSMAYYTVQATDSERYNYCVWRVSNLFQVFDPMTLLSTQEK
jgi:murein DD-endopeptidase MepM/ murein hydrolase activator NlpD